MQQLDFTECAFDRGYARVPPSITAPYGGEVAKLLELYAALAETRAERPNEGYYRLKKPIAFNASIVLLQDSSFLQDTVSDITVDATMEKQILGAPRIDVKALGGDQGVPYVLISKPGFRNYGHFLTDIAPKLVNLHRANLGVVNLVLSAESKAFLPLVLKLVEKLDLKLNILFCPNGYCVSGEEIIYFSSVQKHNKYKSKTLTEMRNLLLPASENGIASSPKKLLVLRKESESRSFSDIEAIVHVADNFGFFPIYPQDFSWGEQIILFSRASHIVGGLGAGLANILFSSSDAKIMMIDPGYGGLYFWDLACISTQNFHFLFSGPITPFSNSLANDPIHVDSELFSTSLRHFVD